MLRSVSALVRFVVGGAAILAWATPAATQSVFTCNGSPASCSVGAGTYTSPASVSIQSPNFSADNAGTFNVTASPTTLGAITVQSVSTAINFDGNPSGGFSFTNSNAVTFTGPSSLGTTSNVYGGVTLKSQGAPGTAGSSGGGGGGTSGPISAQFSGSGRVTTNFSAQTGGTYGILMSSLGGGGGSTTSDKHNAGNGGLAGALSLSLTSVSISQTQAGNPGAAIAMFQVGGSGGSAMSQDNATGGNGGNTDALTLSMQGGGASFIGGNIGGNGAVAAILVNQQGGVGGNLADSGGGGNGGAAGPMSLTLNTGASALGASAMIVNQIGGVGGLGNTSTNAGLGGATGLMTVNITDGSFTSISGGGGLLLNQTGGAGGSGDSVNARDHANGNTGGAAGGITLTLAQSGSGNVFTGASDQANAPGLSARSTGGAGGSGANTGGGLQSFIGSGNGANGGTGGTVSVTSTGKLTASTGYTSSPAIAMISTGGTGGNGGEVTFSLDSSAGVGGAGGWGGSVILNLGAGVSASTSGMSSPALLAAGIGGAGGAGGRANGESGATGAAGGTGGSTNAVTVTLASGVTLSTTGDQSAGLLVQSLGGQGGVGGLGSGGLLTGTGGNGGSGGAAGGAGVSRAITVTSAATITTKGASSVGLLAQAIAGAGGAGGLGEGTSGNGGAGGNYGAVAPISITNTGAITTTGAQAYGLLAQSVAGGGGTGGSSSGFFSDPGPGGAASVGGAVSVTHGGSITVSGNQADGLLAQSVGGGGGTGGNGQGIFYSQGGSGAAGGNGGTVDVTVTGAVTTRGDLGTGVVAQSIGGGGGDGGNVRNDSAVVTVAIGGSAGKGGTGGSVLLNMSGATISTTGTGAVGVLAQGVGGGGGAGGASYGLAVGPVVAFGAVVGGSGGVAGDGGPISVLLANNTRITTSGNQSTTAGVANPVDAHGLLLQSIGGGGGVGGGASAYTIVVGLPTPSDATTLNFTGTYSAGGSGGAGGNGSSVYAELDSGTTIATSGHGAFGVLAQSIGGGGGTGGDSSLFMATIGSGNKYVKVGGGTETYTLNIAVGGGAGSGGTADLVYLNVGYEGGATVSTFGDYAPGVVAQSVGGGGGNAGVGSANAYSTGNTSTYGLNLTIGQNGGSGSTGGPATIVLFPGAVVRTAGSSSPGVIAQSAGGGGGIGSGGSVGVGSLSEGVTSNTALAVRLQIGLGQQGGTGGAAGSATVQSQGIIQTIGNDSPGIIVQSIGGGGGIGGTAGNDSAATDSTDTSNGTAALVKGSRASLVSGPTLTARFDLTLNMGGDGGSGGTGGLVTVTQQGSITTSGDHSPGILAQSIGGGGGKGGVAVAGSETNTLKSIAATLYINSNASLGMSGSGGTGNDGGAVNVTLNPGTIVTGLAGQGSAGAGFLSHGVVAQSVGGGGGQGADGTTNPGGALYLGGAFGGGGGKAANGGAVTINQTTSGVSSITTYGNSAIGLFAQSIGGGGGIAGAGSSLVAGTGAFNGTVSLSLGGRANGTTGTGGTVLVNFPGTTIRTSGYSSFGILAQSVGGGGGYASVSGGATVDLTALGGTGSVGNGGAVTANLSSAGGIITTGIGAHGVVAQSVGGGGGIAIQAPVTNVAPSIQFTAPSGVSSTGSGVGGAVSVTSHAPIAVSGAGAMAILAQSVASGGGLAILPSGAVFAGSTQANPTGVGAGTVSVVTQGTITASGENGVAIFAQSAPDNVGNRSGVVTVLVQGGNTRGIVTGGSGAQGAGIWVLGGEEGNLITVDTGVTVSAASGLAINYYGNWGVDVTNRGTISGNSTLGGGTLTNAGTQVVAGPASAGSTFFGRTVVDGNFVQTATGRIVTTADFAGGRAGRLVITRNATLAGGIQLAPTTLLPNIALPVVEVNGTVSGGLSGIPSTLFGYQVTRSANLFHIQASSADFTPAGFVLSASQAQVASHLQSAWDRGGHPALAPLFALLGAAADRDQATYAAQLRQLSADSTVAPGARAAAGTQAFARLL